YYPVQTLTVHHTAGSNDLTQDYAATVRAIYSYHVESNHWSDIGYQYLVDGHGTVYEGRNSGHTSKSCLYDGGDGSDFAHQAGTDDVVTGANVRSYNQGNVGIALMGCYEQTSATCSGATTPPAAAVDALESELALLANRHGLDTQGTVHYVNPATGATKDVPTISGHRDWMSTACPGAKLYAQLPAIRSNVASRVAGTTPMDSAVVAFRRGSQTVRENVGTVPLVVTRSGNTGIAAAVDYTLGSGSTATKDTDFSLTPGTLTFAAGETSTTVPLTIKDDTAREAGERVVVSLRNPGAATVVGYPASTTVTIAPSDQRPDGWISTAASSGYVGNDVYNTTGYQQTRTLKGRRTQARTFYVRVYNDGNVKNSFAVRGSAARSGSRVRYLHGSTDVTTAMRSTNGWKVTLAPGAYRLLKVQITVLRTASFGSLKPATVRSTWTGDGTRDDLVKAVVKVTR
ncbi:MAG: N-acetylmuramoyl-L-alanine amidase, partial [Oryzihumus sp.]